MAREILGIPLTNAILTLGIAWGVLTFLMGLVGSFVFTGQDYYTGLIAVLFGYLMVLPETIVAFWWPKISAACLLFSFLVLEFSLFKSAGLRYVFIGALVMGLPTAALA